MLTFTAYAARGCGFCFDPLVKNDTYSFLHFIPAKESPEKVKMIVSLYEKDNTFIEEHNFVLELDDNRKNYNNNHIGLVYDGLKQKMIFSALNPENNIPLEKICICVAVTKIKDGNDDEDGGNYLRPRGPKVTSFIEH
ncbi:hypothetical protein [Flavobacterium sangjuense]|uniref:Uncharacterized protein n=1 Tax=Flavobacterium sangjuense TaxID=2518177 RepID=A0A4P7PV54_9FLAO|nr:hypothetical protein [Flavobacterium sangjuense]QBZ98858.1 hypothetical protein GS03_02370 [Flavobacterium sangjuense]